MTETKPHAFVLLGPTIAARYSSIISRAFIWPLASTTLLALGNNSIALAKVLRLHHLPNHSDRHVGHQL